MSVVGCVMHALFQKLFKGNHFGYTETAMRRMAGHVKLAPAWRTPLLSMALLALLPAVACSPSPRMESIGSAPDLKPIGLSEESRALADRLLSQPVPTPFPAPVAPPPPVRAPLESVAWLASESAPAAPPADTATTAPHLSSTLPRALPRPRAVGEEADFILAIARPARSAQGAAHIPTSITIGQAILESDWGRSELARDARNYFGIKAFGRAGSAGWVMLPTVEYQDGEWLRVHSAFRAYKSLDDSVANHNRFLLENSRYRPALQQSDDPEAFAYALQRAGYGTDPRYAAKLLGIMDRYDLYRFDAR